MAVLPLVDVRMNILVTGCTGFVGKAVCLDLLDKGYHVTGTARKQSAEFKEAFSGKKFSFIKSNLANSDSINRILSEKHIDCVIHLAAYIPEKNYSYQNCMATNCVGTFNLLESMKSHNVSNLIFASSQMVYAESVSSPIKEDSDLRPSTFYGLSKKHGEELAEHYAHSQSINTIILRFSGIYGPGKKTGAVYNFIKLALAGYSLTVEQKNKVKDIIYIADAVRLISAALTKIRSEAFAIINAGGNSISLQRLAEKIIELTHSDSALILKEGGTQNKMQLCMQKAVPLLNHRSSSLDDSLTELISVIKQS